MKVNGMLHGVDPSGKSPHCKPLAGVRVLELARDATVSSCASILSHLGAEVLQLVPPTPAHSVPAGAGDGASGEGHNDGANARGSSSGQPHSLTIDFAGPAERELILQLAKECDVFLGNPDVVQMTRCGLDYEAVWKVNRRIIYLLQSECGQGEDSAHAESSQSGLHGAIAVLGALRHREVHGGPGQAIDLAARSLLPGKPWFAAARDDAPGTPPGQVARHILSDWLSLSKEQLTCLVNDGVI
ncbi:CoA transferase [Cupriavidus sp. NPDC089707]|uniref:CoA transferase n=1 Tax=Cupriavidus sp. NPDC089707 TaxID=3363963 RepID=UPI0037FC9D1F